MSCLFFLYHEKFLQKLAKLLHLSKGNYEVYCMTQVNSNGSTYTNYEISRKNALWLRYLGVRCISHMEPGRNDKGQGKGDEKSCPSYFLGSQMSFKRIVSSTIGNLSSSPRPHNFHQTYVDVSY